MWEDEERNIGAGAGGGKENKKEIQKTPNLYLSLIILYVMFGRDMNLPPRIFYNKIKDSI